MPARTVTVASGRWLTRRRPQRRLTTDPRPATGPAWTTVPPHAARTGRAGRRREIDAAVRAPGERCRAGVGEGARQIAGDRPLPSLGQGGGGDRRERQDRGHGQGRGCDGKSGRGRGGAHADERYGRDGAGRPGRACWCGVGAESLQVRAGSSTRRRERARQSKRQDEQPHRGRRVRSGGADRASTQASARERGASGVDGDRAVNAGSPHGFASSSGCAPTSVRRAVRDVRTTLGVL